MKRRYSPAARRAHLRAMRRAPVVQQVATIDPLPGDPKYPMFDFIRDCHRQVNYVAQGLVTMRELADNISWMVERWEVDTAPATSCELPSAPVGARICMVCDAVYQASEGHAGEGHEIEPVRRHTATQAQPEPAPKSEQPIDCDCSDCLAEKRPAPQGRCIGCGALTPDAIPVDVDGLFGEDWCCKQCQGEQWAKPISSNDPVYVGPERPQEWDPQTGWPVCSECGGFCREEDDGVCATCWAKPITPPSPPWEGGAA